MLLRDSWKGRDAMSEQEYEQRMQDLQREYVDFLDDSDRDGMYDRWDDRPF